MEDIHIESSYPEGQAGGIASPHGTRSPRPSLIIIHSTRSGIPGREDKLELASTLNSFHNGNNGAHCIVTASGHRYWTVPLHWQAWGASYLNPRAFHIEITQPTKDTPYTDLHYSGTVEAARQICDAYPDIPLLHIEAEGDNGIIGHEETLQGISYGKSDPGPRWDWDRFMEELTHEEDSMRPIPLILDDLYDVAHEVRTLEEDYRALYPSSITHWADELEKIMVEIKTHIYRDPTLP